MRKRESEKGLMTKKCSKCKIEKPKSEFSKNSRSKDNLRSQCKECIKTFQHELVCGLHVPENLQILTESENLSKKNKFESHKG